MKVESFRLVMENKFIQMAASIGYAVAHTIGPVSKYIIDNAQVYFRWSSFWSWRVCKQAKLSQLGHRKPARLHLKADASKTSHCLVQILVQGHN